MVKILVTGETGVLGRSLSKLFLANQTDFIVGSRNKNTKNYNNDRSSSDLNVKWTYMNLTKTEGLNESIGTILHLASIPMQKIDGQPSDVILTKNLLNSIPKKNIKHFIHISIVGIDKIPFSFYQGKLKCERLIKSSGIPCTILRATQFRDFVDVLTSKMLTLPIGLVPKALKTQPIQLEAVAMELNKITQESPSNSKYDIGSKKVYNLGEITDSLLKARHEKKIVFLIHGKNIYPTNILNKS
jgi:uncharacterized protein YbjT (DUF2867 family)